MKPQRVQLKRTKGWRMPANTVKVDRATRWGNPWRAGKTYHEYAVGGDPWSFPLITDAAMAVDVYRRALSLPDRADFVRAIKSNLRGKNLACWCKPGDPCHADVLLELANK
jgi:hypothetical protein